MPQWRCRNTPAFRIVLTVLSRRTICQFHHLNLLLLSRVQQHQLTSFKSLWILRGMKIRYNGRRHLVNSDDWKRNVFWLWQLKLRVDLHTCLVFFLNILHEHWVRSLLRLTTKRSKRVKARFVYNDRKQSTKLLTSFRSPTLSGDSPKLAFAVTAHRQWSFATTNVKCAFAKGKGLVWFDCANIEDEFLFDTEQVWLLILFQVPLDLNLCRWFSQPWLVKGKPFVPLYTNWISRKHRWQWTLRDLCSVECPLTWTNYDNIILNC